MVLGPVPGRSYHGGFGILTLFFIVHTPERAIHLTEEEKAAAIFRMKFATHGAAISTTQNLKRSHGLYPVLMFATQIKYFCRQLSPAIITPIYIFPLSLPSGFISQLSFPDGPRDELPHIWKWYLKETCEVRRPRDHRLQSRLEQRHRTAVQSPAQRME